MIEYKRFFKILLVLSLSIGEINFINLKDNSYIYTQNKTIYENEDNNKKQEESTKQNKGSNLRQDEKQNKDDDKNKGVNNNQNIQAEDGNKKNKDMNKSQDISKEYEVYLKDLFDFRNKALMDQNEEILKGLYNTDIKFGLWAYEHEIKKMQYLKNWSDKQGVVFDEIDAKVKVNKMREREENLYGIICTVCTKYKYYYKNQPEMKNEFQIGTQHYLHVKVKDDKYVIRKEWYSDPFADSLNLEHINSQEIKSYILAQNQIQLDLSDRQKKAIDYAHKYCGAATNVSDRIYLINPNYKDFNGDGGDCANFASQIMFESGTFSKNPTWNYENGSATKAWVNAQGFKNYLIYSGRGYYLGKGSYEEVYKQAYKLRPGDIVGYEKNGRITHVSTVTGLDSKGYPLVTCHNTDRLLVPWDLGWSDKSIRFHLIKVNY
ncbi:amidase domain-containing protein [Intestinibacter sp.]